MPPILAATGVDRQFCQRLRHQPRRNGSGNFGDLGGGTGGEADGASTGAIDCDSTRDVGGPTNCTARPETKRGMGTSAQGAGIELTSGGKGIGACRRGTG